MDELEIKSFETLLERLRSEIKNENESTGAYKSEASIRCHDSLFTKDSEDCYACTYCNGCSLCTNCTHCHECTAVNSSSYCYRSEFCSGCSYVSESSNCHDCLFCVGCVGLVKKEFYILNRPYKKDVFFKLVEKLEKALGKKLR